MKSDPRDYKLEISSLPPSEPAADAAPAGRAYLSVLFNCCRVYQRVYKNADGSQYAGRCPKCGKTVRFVVGANGTGERSFVVE